MKSENETLERNIINLENDPSYFGAYLNMARHNIYLIIKELESKFKISAKMEKEEDIRNSFILDKTILDKTNANHIYSHLIRFLPIARTFSSDFIPISLPNDNRFQGVDFGKMTCFFKLCFKELNEFRNDYTHYYSVKTGEKKKIKISEDFAVFLRESYLNAIEFTKRRFKDVFVEKDYDLTNSFEIINEQNEITNRGMVFLCCLFLDKENAFNFINKINGFKGTQTNVFLTTREVFSVFCITLPHDKFISDDPKQAFQLDILNYLNRCPKELYNALTLDGKKQFHPTLNESSRYSVIENSITESIEDSDYQDYIELITVKKRSSDRFAGFALKYLDQLDSFHFNFQINLGKGLKKSYKKTVLGNVPEEKNRNIIEDVISFGKLNEFLKTGAEAILCEESAFKKKYYDEDKNVFMQYSPHYHLTNNKIGLLCFKNRRYNGKLYRPLVSTAFLSVHELPKLVLLELLEKEKSSEIINEFIKINSSQILNEEFVEKIKNELAYDKVLYKVFFDERLKNKDWKIVNETIKEKLENEIKKINNEKALKSKKEELKALNYAIYVKNINNRKERLSEILVKYNLKVNQIPSRIIEYWLNIKDTKQEVSIKNRIRAEKKECKKRINDLDNGKSPKIGEIATFLARDIVNLVIDADVKSKITSFYYDLLQESLALYENPVKKNLFIEICNKELQLFNKELGHPFLKDIQFNNLNKLRDLYVVYLELKGTRRKDKNNLYSKEDNWMSNTFYDSKNGKNKIEIRIPTTIPIPLTYKKLQKEPNDFQGWLRNLTERYSKDPKMESVDLPTNLFDAHLVNLLKKKVGISESDTKTYNYSKLLELWLNDTQSFYNSDREYIIFKNKEYETSIKFKLGSKPSFKDYYSPRVDEILANRRKENSKIQRNQIITVLKKAIVENEKIIRFYQTKDRVTLLMLDKMIEEELGIKLAEISPVSKSSPLEQQIDIKQQLKIDNVVYIITDRCKRKNVTLFKKFISDNRLKELLKYYTNTIIPHVALKKELEEYNKYKECIFRTVFELEKAIIEVVSTEEYEQFITESDNNISHKIYLGWLKKYNIIDDNEHEWFTEIRNKFSHNKFPRKQIMEKYFDLKEKSFAKQIAEEYLGRIEKIIQEKLKV
ncbi:type VI-B CRISPR-associated RNA-guided ribonuclease Cas13b [Flavobacterium sp. '19STA2R22 D10 B1']|uniref:type VI-B CRISPR-associated RNA-guided ribonuclease Cas13b n=1 Tax=Flavobacterium aerium TaxID=3037261 RepID=UPI00278BDE01|nr:type VI-B CRISPR-associated RNA-guided ribonuclease Cas13b [Flavobacterium sp. '19STA2R22 D10 B1']